MKPDVLRELRDMMPSRPLGFDEALRLAEQQAGRLLLLRGVEHPAVPDSVISELPRIEVRKMAPFPTSGASHWSQGRWRVAVNANEPATRQRFSLAHEFKHIIDHRDVDLLYAAFPERERAVMIERICDYFAGCLLVPRPWVLAAHASGTQHVMDLAMVFSVSPSAVTVRLNQIGITKPAPRCSTARHGWPAPTSRHQTHFREPVAVKS